MAARPLGSDVPGVAKDLVPEASVSAGLRSILAALRHHPWRTLCVVIAIAGLALGGYVTARTLWAPNLYQEVESALQRYDFKAAQRHLTPHLEEQPDDPTAHFLAARAARYAGDFAQAAEHLRSARLLGYPEDSVMLEHLLQRASQHHDRTALAELQTRASAGGPDTPAILEVLVQDYVETYRLREAVSALDHLLELRPGNVKALVGRGRVKERLFDFAAAVLDYREALRLEPDNDEARARLAAVLLINGRPEDAAAEFERLRLRQGDSPEVLVGLARCRRKQGKLQEALDLLDQLLKQTPDNATALAERGKVALELGRPEQAEPSLRRAVRLAPYDREAQHSLYQCLRLVGQPEETAAALARYQELDANLRRLDKVTSAVLASPGDLSLRCEAADLFFRLGEPGEGVRWLRGVLQIDPHHAAAHHALARHYRDTGHPDLAAEHERRAGPPGKAAPPGAGRPPK
jgi:predicted Zn-dependent protease